MSGNIYALKGDPGCDIAGSLIRGEGRFGWSYVKSADLRKLKQRIEKLGWESLTNEERDCYQVFMLDFKEGDRVVYINVPERGRCTIARVTGPYTWRFEDKDFNHRFPVDPTSVYEYNRNDAIVHPALRRRLKLQGRWWRIYLQNEFDALSNSLESGIQPATGKSEDNLRLLSNSIEPYLLKITESIHHTHPNYDLEALFEQVFLNVPGVTDVLRQGGAGDHGADLVVKFKGGLPIPGLEIEGTLVVQVKSFEGEHWDTRAVKDIRRAFEHYPQAVMGLIISTASASTVDLDRDLEQLKACTGKAVALLIGRDVAAFLLRFGTKL